MADLNGDGFSDIVLVGSNLLTVLFGNGVGGFVTQTQLTTVGQTYSVAVADLNGDHNLDLVATNSVGTISVFYGTGNNHFQAGGSYEANDQPQWVITGKFFVTDATDIVVWNNVANLGTGPAYSMIRVRNGVVAAQPTTQIGPASAPGVMADMNKDGITDMIIPVIGPPAGVEVLAGSANGTFGPALGGFSAGVNQLATPLIADFNQDGLSDVAVVMLQQGTTIYVGLQQANGSYSVVQTAMPWKVGTILCAGDLNGDHRPDLLVTGTTSPGIWVLLGNDDGTFLPPVLASAVGGLSVFGDFNGDGKIDLINASNSGLIYQAGKGDGTFGSAGNISKLVLSVIVSGDFNGDGKLDIAGVFNSRGLYIFLGNGDGTFKQTVADSFFPLPFGLLPGDFNGDGKLDLLSWGSSSDLTIYLGLGNGKFVTPTGSYFCVTSSLCFPSAVDMNGDGRLDIVSDFYLGGILSTLIQK